LSSTSGEAGSTRARVTALAILRRLPIEFDFDQGIDEEALLGIARRYRLSVYDAAYLELAQRERIALATLDSALAKAARAENVQLIGV
jgi:predicted nucleic acid-binding protein